jgi:hypothetical protein
MKIKTYAIISLFALFIFSCSVVDNLLTFSIDQQTSFTIPAGVPANSTLPFTTPDISTNSSTVFENNNTKTELVKDVKLKELKLTITNPATQSFSFLKSVHLYISTTSSDEIELAYLDNINSTSTTLNLTCTAEKLDKYVKAPSFKIRVSGVSKEATTQAISVQADMKFQVTADPF